MLNEHSIKFDDFEWKAKVYVVRGLRCDDRDLRHVRRVLSKVTKLQPARISRVMADADEGLDAIWISDVSKPVTYDSGQTWVHCVLRD